MHTENNVLIEISPHLRIPRTYKRFAGLMGESSLRSKVCSLRSPKHCVAPQCNCCTS